MNGGATHIDHGASSSVLSERGSGFTGSKNGFLLAYFCVIGLCSTACAGPYGGKSLIPAHIVFKPIAGYVLTHADIVSERKGAMIHGTICRRDVTSFPISQLAVEWARPGEPDSARENAYIYGMSSWRRPACGFYTAETDWRVSPDDTIRIGLLD